MNRSRPSLIVPATILFAGFDLERRRWTTPEFTDDLPDGAQLAETNDADREQLLRHCRAMLLPEGDNLSSSVLDRLSIHLVRVCNNCYRAGLRQSAIIQARKAQTAKKHKADARGRIVRRAILSVCERQRVTPVASEKFATSIRTEVIEAARQFGLADVKSGTSTRSIQRHISALVKIGGEA